MQLKDAIWARRAVRAYEARGVDEAILRGLLEAAVQAPSAMNSQDWQFAIVQDRKQLERYSTRAKALLLEQAEHDANAKTRQYADLLSAESFNIFYDAGTLVVIGCGHRGPYAEANCWLAAENLMLAACELGLGTCCIGFAVPVLNLPDVMAELSLPAAGAAVAPIIVGYPSTTLAPIPRSAPKIVSWSRS